MGWGVSIPGTNIYVGQGGVTSRNSGTAPGGTDQLNPLAWQMGPLAAYGDSEERNKKLKADEESQKRLTQASRDNLNRLRNQSAKLAQDFKANLPQYQKGLLDVAMTSNRNALANKIQTQNEDLSARGLISSGIQQGKTAKAQAQAQTDLASKESEINQQVMDTSNEFDDYVTNMGLNLANYEQNDQNEYYRSALDNLQKKYSAMGQAGKALGGLVGTYAAQKG